MSRCLKLHDEKVRVLSVLAALIGCHETMGGQLPDGRRPDILRISTKDRILFLGDAKHTESPRCTATQARLLTYLHWFSSYTRVNHSLGIFAICFAKQADAHEWVRTAYSLGREAGIVFSWHGLRQFEADLFIAWFCLGNR